ncbi:hypothetical protein UFOVP17_31 [uncultured Caudovirales phage]|uniref:Uncharacterized protein n=1 Tax=uncultured Caudovirales phage TaxID=2100421 RepID=A0A6J5KM35_9CAUD|nr:hypothetical protein UFOVP17_31 [uncultured Caudovirales phage]
MALPITITNTFATATGSIPLSQLDANFTQLTSTINGVGDGTTALATPVIGGGTINGAVIGGTTPAQGTFTNVVSTGDVYESTPTPTALTATGTLTISQMLTNIVTVTSATAVGLTLPTGALTDAGILSGTLPVNGCFDWYIINLGSASGAVTMAAGTTHTYVGLTTIPISSQAAFRTRKTATNTFVTYRIS